MPSTNNDVPIDLGKGCAVERIVARGSIVALVLAISWSASVGGAASQERPSDTFLVFFE